MLKIHLKKLKKEIPLLKHVKIGLEKVAVVKDAPVVIVVITFGFVMVSGFFVVIGVDSTLLQLSVLLQQKSPDAIPFVILPV